MSLFSDACARLKGYNLGIYNAITNALGLSGVGGMAANWAKALKDMVTVGETVATMATDAYAVGGSARLSWDTGTADANPGAGKLRGNNATLASVTALYVSTTDGDGADIAAILATWGTGTSMVKGALRLAVVGDRSQRADFLVTGAVTTHTGYVTIPVSFVSTSTTLTAGTGVVLGFVARGDKGNTGPVTTYWGGTAGGTANALTATTGASLSALTAGMIVGLKSGASANSGATTVAVDSVPAIAVRKNGSALSGGEIPANTDVWFEFDGTYLRLLSGGLPAATNASTVAGTSTVEAVTPASLAAWVPGLTAASTVDTANDYILLSTPSGPRKILASAVGLGSGPARRYLRLRALTDSFATDNGTKYLIWREVKPYATVDASGSPVTVSSASASSQQSGNEASKAFDGDLGTGWATSTSPATYQYLVMDFGTAVTIRSISINASSSGGPAYIASSLAVESSPNGTDWTLVATVYPANTPNTFQAFQHIQ